MRLSLHAFVALAGPTPAKQWALKGQIANPPPWFALTHTVKQAESTKLASLLRGILCLRGGSTLHDNRYGLAERVSSTRVNWPPISF